MLRLEAGVVHPVTAPRIAHGAVLVDETGRIAAIGPDALVPRPPGARTFAFPGGLLVPGLVNCHTHLELTELAGRVPPLAFPAWIRSVRAAKDATPPEAFARAAQQGLRDCWAAGVTCIADTGSTGAALDALHALGGRGVGYQEVFGPATSQVASSLAELERTLDYARPATSARVRLGVSPHAPYTVSAPLYRAVAALARREGLPTAVHIAESPDESAFVHDGRGPFADAWQGRGIAVEPHHLSPVGYLAALDVLDATVLCIHCVQLDATDIDTLRRTGVAIAHCPRSNRAHGHGVAPLAALRAAGIRVGLGTDSVVSAGDVELAAEASAAGLGGDDALRMLTLEGARALGWDDRIGSLEVGKEADLAVFPLAPSEAVGREAVLTVVAGRVVHG
ncbi:MAG TPA: amidohydrolase family protein [Gemmatimonadales bacterium]|nr:amidohydrolase family protein [Gemmatimonadales bacterium]